LWRLILVLGLTAVAAAGARGALVPDLHELDRIRAHRVRPSRPVLICNPRSGNGKVTRLGLAERASGLGVDVVMLEPGSDLEHLARAAIARGADCLGMAGGDGSQALVASIAVEHDLPFVCISAGTRNHFALDLGLAKDDPAAGLGALVDGVERRVDYGSVNGRLFVNNVSLGVYATIVQDEAYRGAKVETTRQKLPTLVGPEAQPFDLQFTTPEGREIDGAFLVMVSNNQYFLSPGLDIAQRRSLDSGRLGVIAVTGTSAAEAGRLVGLTAIGGGARDPNLHVFSVETFEVRSRSGSAAAGIDGEAVDLSTPMRFEIHPRGLRVLVPPESVQTAEIRRTRGMQLRALVDVARGRPARLDA
jgi:diacylglycerol kinase family enzyme